MTINSIKCLNNYSSILFDYFVDGLSYYSDAKYYL